MKPLQTVSTAPLKQQQPKAFSQSAASKLPTLQEQDFRMNGASGMQRSGSNGLDSASKNQKQPLIGTKRW
jgi:hypothetical protein